MRQTVREEIYYRVVPNLEDPDKLAANELVTDPVHQAEILVREIARLTAARDAAADAPQGAGG